MQAALHKEPAPGLQMHSAGLHHSQPGHSELGKAVISETTCWCAFLQAAFHGVPIVGIPVFGDQPDNVMKAVYRGFGLMISPGAFQHTYIPFHVYRIPKYRSE